MNARDYHTTAWRLIVRISGSNSRNSPNLFEPNSLAMLVIPVILPPGRFKLATIPSATGSLPAANTMEISVAELVACTTFAARMAEVPNGTITLTRKLSRSFVKLGSRS